MKKTAFRWLQIIGGIVLIFIGIAGLFLPLLQGVLLIIAGITLISPYHGKKIMKRGKNIWRKYVKKSPKKNSKKK